MAPSASVSEIVECKEMNLSCGHGHKKPSSAKPIIEEIVSISRSRHPSDNELIRLFEALDLKKSSGVSNPSSQVGGDLTWKKASKKPAAGVGASRSPGIGVTEPVSLKQALRKLSISHASAVAAAKRLQKPMGLSDVSEAGTIQRLYATVVVQASEKSQGQKEKQDVLEIHIVPETPLPEKTEEKKESSQTLNTCKTSQPSSRVVAAATMSKNTKAKSRTMNVSKSVTVKSKPRAGAAPRIKGKLKRDSSTEGELNKKTVSSIVTKPTFKNSSSSKRKKDKSVPSVLEKSCSCNGAGRICSSPSKDKQVLKEVIKQVPDEEIKQVQEVVILSNTMRSYELPSSSLTNGSQSNRVDSTPSGCNNTPKAVGPTPTKQPKSRQKGDCSHSSKSSIGDFSASTSFSSESLRSGSSGFNSRPHMSKDVRWVAIRNIEMQYGAISLRNFKLLKRLGCGDIGTVYLAELTGTDCLFALKVMDNEFLLSRKKMLRAQTEREILQMLDHPFLPTLYTYFTTDNLSCLVMEYCPGGDLHVLRQQQPARCFPEPAARFYVAEVLLALEYLHMLGVVYRDLKPENILVREDGHIMLSDFDLSLRCSVCPTLLKSSSLGFGDAARGVSGPCTESSCIDPLCLQPSWVPGSCFTPAPKTRKQASEFGIMGGRLPQVVVEPTEARSNSFVGTHEYLAPEIIKGEGHGSSVDWWTFGIFLYELLFGHTPFKGHTNEETLANVVTESLMFPESPTVSFHAIDLIRGLLAKEPEYRLGSLRGAAEIKQHPFFRGLNWALIRCALPPEIPGPSSFGIIEVPEKEVGKSLDFSTANGEGVEFELF